MRLSDSIAAKINLLVLVMMTAVMTLTTLTFFRVEWQEDHRLLERSTRHAADRIAHTLAVPLWNVDTYEIDRALAFEAGNRDIAGVVLEADVLNVPLEMGKVQSGEGELVDFRPEAGHRELLANSYLTYEREVVHDGRTLGVVSVYVTSRPVREYLWYELLFASVQAAAAGIVTVLILVWSMRRMVVRPLRELATAAHRLGEEDFSAAVPVRSSDEIGGVARAFNEMARQVRQNIERAREHGRQLENEMSERRRAEQDLQRRHGELLLAQRLARLGSWSLDVRTGGVAWSEQMYEIFRWDPEQGPPSPAEHEQLLHPEDFSRAMQTMNEALATGRGYEIEFRLILPGGGVRQLITHAEVEKDGDDNVVRLYGITQDITERKRMEEERRELETQIQHTQKLESLGVLAGGIAHDFNNLLVAILGNVNLAQEDVPEDSPARESLSEIESASRRAADLCQQMLAYSGRGQLVVGPINLNDVVREMSDMLKVAISKKVVLRTEFTEDIAFMEGDVTQLRQILMNLITNASEAVGEEEGAITVRTGVMHCTPAYLEESYLNEPRPEGEYVYLEVTDTGRGMDAETLERLFDPFFTTKFTGRGLGLSAVLGIVRGHRGAVRVSSRPGAGTAIRVLFPAIEAPAQVGPEEAVPQAEQAPSAPGTVLVADDEEIVLNVARKVLTRSGFRVLPARDGREAVRVYRERANDIDCVLLDLTMPHLNGRQALHEMKRIRQDIPIIICSGYNEKDLTERFSGEDVAAFLHKPYQVSALLEAVRGTCDGGQKRQAGADPA